MPTLLRTTLTLACLAPVVAGCNLVSESLLVQNKPALENPPINPVPNDMKGSPLVTTPPSMKNRFSYYGLEHAE